MRVNGLKLTLLISLFLVVGFFLVFGSGGLFIDTPASHTVVNGSTLFNLTPNLTSSLIHNVVNVSYYLFNDTSSILLAIDTNLSGNQTRWNITINLNASNLTLSEGSINSTLGAYRLMVNITNWTNQMFNYTIQNLSVDNRRPDMYNVNVTDGSIVLGQNQLNGTKYLTNVTLTVMADIVDTSGAASLVYNITRTVNLSGRLERDFNNFNLNSNTSNPGGPIGPAGVDGTRAVNYISSSGIGSRGVLNATLPAFPHGVNVSFGIYANDSMAATGTSSSRALNTRAANNSVGYNFTVDGIRPSAQLTVTNGGITVSDQGTVTRGVIPVITCRDASGDTLPSSSLNITVDRPGSADNSPQATAGVGKRGSGDTIVLNFDTAGSGESNGEFTVTCTTSDIGSSSSATSRFTVLASAGSGDSSGGSSSGGGAGSSEAPQTTTKTVEFAAIDAGKLKVVQNFGSGAGLKSISFKIKAAVTAASMEVSTSATKPSTVSSTPNSKVARYFEVKTTNIDNNNIQEATINFEVDKAWMESNSIKDNEIALYRYADNKWEKFVATKSPAQGSTSKITYRANVPGFSVWAIAFSEAAAPSTGETGETGGTGEGGTGTEPTTEEETKPNKAGTIILWIVIIVIVVGAIAYYLMRKKKPSKK